MPAGRPSIPRELERAVLVEAGHRCAIPTCRQAPVELHHIDSWSKVQAHSFENLIALCPTCHARVTRGDIDRQAVGHYKRNLGLLNARYGEMERRLMEWFAERPEEKQRAFPRRMNFEFMYLTRDGLLIEHPPVGQLFPRGGDLIWRYELTDAGVRTVELWRTGAIIP